MSGFVTVKANSDNDNSWIVKRYEPLWYCSGFTYNQANAVADQLNSQERRIRILNEQIELLKKNQRG